MNIDEQQNILYRSLYLLKKKFEIYKNDINKIYTKYFVKDKNNYNNITCKIIKIYSFKSLLEEVCNLIYISIFKMNSINELFISNFIPEIKKKERLNEAIDKIYNYISDKIKKYNEIFYNRKLKSAIELKEIEDIADDYTEYYPISEYDKKGHLINYFDQLKNINIENELKSNELTLKDEYELNIKEEDIIYIETLPIIIADFINLNPKFVIINNKIDDYELNQEIKNLFDGEILKKLEKENSDLDEKILHLPSYEDQTKLENIIKKKEEIDKKIKLYKQLIFHKKKNNENVQFLQVFVDKLNEEKEKYIVELNEEKEHLKKNKMNNINNLNNEKDNESEKKNNEKIYEDINNNNNNENINDSNLTINNTELNKSNFSSNKKYILKKDELNDNLYEIFCFYANHQNKKLNSPTFSRMAFRKVLLNFDEFNKFLNDFDVKIQKEILIELFKRNSTNNYMIFEQFKEVFWKIGLPMNNYRKEKLIKKIKHLKEYINKIKNEDPYILDKNFLKSKGNKTDISNDIKIENSENQIFNFEKEYKRLNSLNYDGVINEFDDYIGIAQPKIYREKMKGFYDLKERFNYNENGENNYGKAKIMKIPLNHFRIYNKDNQSIRNKLIEKRIKTGKKIKLFLKSKINDNDNDNNNNINNDNNINQIDSQIEKGNEKQIKEKEIFDNSKEEYNNELINKDIKFKNKNNELINSDIEFKSKNNELINPDIGINNKDEIKFKEKEDLKKKIQLDEEEKKRKEEQLNEEKKRNIYSYNKIEQSALKDIDIDEYDEKLKLIDSESNNSDDDILNRYGNLFKTERQKEIKISNLNNTENENIIDNENENKNENENNIIDNEKNNKIENENNNILNFNMNESKEEDKGKTNILNRKFIKNNKKQLSISLDNKKQIVKNNNYKSPINSLLKRNIKFDGQKIKKHPLSSIKRNNEFTSYQKYNKSLVINNQRENALKNAGENIINSNYNSFNEQKNSFINQNIINTDSNIQFLNNNNSLSGKNKNFKFTIIQNKNK